MRCPSCGNNIKPGKNYCPFCGTEISSHRKGRNSLKKDTGILPGQGKYLLLSIMILCLVAGGIYSLTRHTSTEGDAAGISSILPGSVMDINVSCAEEALSALDSLGKYYGYESAEDVYSEDYTQDTGLFTAYQFSQVYEGLEVIGHSTSVIVDEDGTVLYFTGNYAVLGDVSTDPKIIEKKAVKKTGLDEEDCKVDLCIYVLEEEGHLVWRVRSISCEYYIDARTGKLLGETSLTSEFTKSEMITCTLNLQGQDSSAGLLEVDASYNASQNVFYLADIERNIYVYENILTPDAALFTDSRLAKAATGAGMRASGVDALYNIERVYDFYQEVLQRTSFAVDASGQTCIYLGLDTASNSNGSWKNNAAATGDPSSNSVYILFADSDYTYDDAKYLGVCAHEYTHAIRAFVLDGQFMTAQGGALDEGLADIFGVICNAYYDGTFNWQLENCDGTIRNMSSPTSSTAGGKYITTYDEYSDSLDEHSASTLLSHVAYLINCQPFLSENYAIQDVQTFAELWYNAMFLLNKYSGFQECRSAVERVAELMLKKGDLTYDQYIGIMISFDVSGIPQESEVYFADENTDLQLVVADGNDSFASIPYTQFTYSITSADGKYQKTAQQGTDIIAVCDIVSQKKAYDAYDIVFSDSYTDNQKSIRIIYLPQTSLATPSGLSGSLSAQQENIEILTAFGSSSWISGRVEDESGNALAEVFVTMSNLDRTVSIQTDESGEYTLFLYYETEKFQLEFSKEGYSSENLSGTYTKNELQSDTKVRDKELETVILTHEYGTLTGIACDIYNDMAAVPWLTIKAVSVTGGQSYSVKSDEYGAYALTLPTGTYQIEVESSKYVLSEENVELEIDKNEETLWNAMLSHQLYLCGYVYDEDGEPMSGVSISAVSEGASSSAVQTDENGYYYIECGFDTDTLTYNMMQCLISDISFSATQEIYAGSSSIAPYQLDDIVLIEKAVLGSFGEIDFWKGGDVLWDSSIPRRSVTSIIFKDLLTETPDETWGTLIHDGRLKAWVLEDSSSDGEYYTLYVAGKGGVYAPSNCRQLFAEFPKLESIELNGCFHTDGVINMEYMFYESFANGSKIDLSGMDFSNVTDVRCMFGGCGFSELSLGNIDTSEVLTMGAMFSGCTSLKILNVEGWNTPKVNDLSWMFAGCRNLKELDLSGWNTSNVWSLNNTFANCESLISLDVSTWDTTKVGRITSCFSDCSSLETLDLSGWDLSNLDTSYTNSSAFKGTKWEDNWKELLGNY